MCSAQDSLSTVNPVTRPVPTFINNKFMRPILTYAESFSKIRLNLAEMLRCVTSVLQKHDPQTDRHTDTIKIYIRCPPKLIEDFDLVFFAGRE